MDRDAWARFPIHTRERIPWGMALGAIGGIVWCVRAPAGATGYAISTLLTVI